MIWEFVVDVKEERKVKGMGEGEGEGEGKGSSKVELLLRRCYQVFGDCVDKRSVRQAYNPCFLRLRQYVRP